MSRRNHSWVALVALAGSLAGCSVGKTMEKQLEGEPCTVEKDCWSTQECTQTIDEEMLGLPGLCEPEGTGCVIGQQLGCDCNPVDPAANCSYTSFPAAIQATYPKMICDAQILVCVVAPMQGGV
jgi:hypothetical protein